MMAKRWTGLLAEDWSVKRDVSLLRGTWKVGRGRSQGEGISKRRIVQDGVCDPGSVRNLFSVGLSPWQARTCAKAEPQ